MPCCLRSDDEKSAHVQERCGCFVRLRCFLSAVPCIASVEPSHTEASGTRPRDPGRGEPHYTRDEADSIVPALLI